MNNDLISRKWLRTAIIKMFGDSDIASSIDAIIDNAPSVEPEITNDDLQVAMTESYRLGYELAETKFKRSQGEWGKWIITEIQCPTCFGYFETDCYSKEELKKCPNCGSDM